MSHAILIHDDACGRAYVYLDGVLVLDVEKSWSDWQAAVADALQDADEAVESEGSANRCGSPPENLSGWSGLLPTERFGEDSMRAIIEIYSIGIIATLIFNDEYIFGEDLFFPDGDAFF